MSGGEIQAVMAAVRLAAGSGATQEEVFRSISQSVDSGGRSGAVLLVVMGLVALVAIVLVMASRQYNRKAAPTTLNHPGKLLKECNRSLRLKKSEVRRLKALAAQVKVNNPVVLLLCPSVLNKAAEGRQDEIKSF